MNATLSAQAKAQLENDPECTTVQIEGGGAIRGIFSQSTGLHTEKGRLMIGAEQPRLTLYIEDTKTLDPKKSVLLIEGKRFGIQKILRFSELYLSEIWLGAAKQADNS